MEMTLSLRSITELSDIRKECMDHEKPGRPSIFSVGEFSFTVRTILNSRIPSADTILVKCEMKQRRT